jgi:hypothetical protein
MSRTAVKLAAVALAAGLAVSACGTIKMGAAAITGSHRISSATLTSQVSNLDAAYKGDQAKGIKPQRPAAQQTQQVLSWLILFRIYDQLAVQHNIHVSAAQSQQQLADLGKQASQSHITLAEYASAAGALPPDLLPELGRYFAIQTELVNKIDGGTTPTTPASQAMLASQVSHERCLAAKSLGVTVNPQFGQYDYASYAVVLAPPTLAANPSPTPSSSPAVLKPPC